MMGHLMNTSDIKRSSANELDSGVSRAKVLQARDAARFVGLSESTLAKLRLNGNGPVYCKLGRRVVYRVADLEQWLQSRTTRDTSDADARFLKALTIAHPR
jgi:predicted DNA-binding transcriptional regulator AlpA